MVKSVLNFSIIFSLRLFVFLLLLTKANAQVKIGDNTSTVASPDPNSMLEIESSNKGLLIPRLELVSTTNSAPLSAHVVGMTAYNTATNSDVTPGYYYNDGVKWIRLANCEKVFISVPDNSDVLLTAPTTSGLVSSFNCVVSGKYVINANARAFFEGINNPFAEVYVTSSPVFNIVGAQLISRFGNKFSSFSTPSDMLWDVNSPVDLTAGVTYYIWIYSQNGGNNSNWGGHIKNVYLHKIN